MRRIRPIMPLTTILLALCLLAGCGAPAAAPTAAPGPTANPAPAQTQPAPPSPAPPPEILVLPLAPNGTVRADLNGDGTQDTVTTRTLGDEADFGSLQTTLTLETAGGSTEIAILYPLNATLLAGDIAGDGGSAVLVVSDTGGAGALGCVVFDLLVEKDGVYVPCDGPFLGAQGSYFSFSAAYDDFPAYRVTGGQTGYETQDRLPNSLAADPAYHEARTLTADGRAGVVNLVLNEEGTGYYIAVHQALSGDTPASPVGRCVSYLRLADGQPSLYKQEYISNQSGAFCRDWVCTDTSHYPAIHGPLDPALRSTLRADGHEVPDFFKAAVLANLHAYEAYGEPGVPYLPAPVEELCYYELQALGEYAAAKQNEALMAKVAGQIALIEGAVGAPITQSTILTLGGSGQGMTLSFFNDRVTIANLAQYGNDDMGSLVIRKVTLGADLEGVYVTDIRDEMVETALLLGYDNHLTTIPRSHYGLGDYRFDGGGMVTMETVETYPVDMMHRFDPAAGDDPGNTRIAWRTVVFAPSGWSDGAHCTALALPGLEGGTVTFAAAETLWVVDFRSRYVALMNEAGDIGVLLVGKDGMTGQMSPSDRLAGGVGYTPGTEYDEMVDNAGNVYPLIDTFQGFNCMS